MGLICGQKSKQPPFPGNKTNKLGLTGRKRNAHILTLRSSGYTRHINGCDLWNEQASVPM
jgi:hypothetical protein